MSENGLPDRPGGERSASRVSAGRGPWRRTIGVLGVLAVILGITIASSGSSTQPASPFIVATATPAPGTSVRVTSIPALLTKLADDTVTEIVVANGTYVVPDAHGSTGQVNGLWIDQRFAARTRPVLVRAETIGGVTISGGGATGWIGLAFRDGVHDQTWQGFRFANAEPTQTGVIVFGQSGSVVPVPPHHITLLQTTIEESITSDSPMSGDHAIYFSKAQSPGVHDIVIDGLTVYATTSGLDSAVHFFHSAREEPNASRITIRHLAVFGTEQAVILWDTTLRDVTIEDSAIAGARYHAIRYEGPADGIVLANVVSTGSGQGGFYSSLGVTPPGIRFAEVNLR